MAKVMNRTMLTIVCDTEEAMQYYTNGLAKAIEQLKKDGPEIIGAAFNEDNYLIADDPETREADKAAFELVKKETRIPISAAKDVPIDLSRTVLEEPTEPIKEEVTK